MPGLFIEYDYRGETHIRGWPRQATQAENAKKLAACQLFIDRVKGIKLEFADSQMAAREMSTGTVLLPRDIQMMLMANTAYGVFEFNGQRYYAMQTAQEVSQSLDVLGSDVGSLLVRTPTGWFAIPPGAVGDLLTIIGGTDPVAWQTPTPPGTGQTAEATWTQPFTSAFPTTNLPAGASIANYTKGITLAGNLSATNINLLVAALQATPTPGATGWFARCRLQYDIYWQGFATLALCVRNSGTGKLAGITTGFDITSLLYNEFTNYTTWSSVTRFTAYGMAAIWFEVRADATHITYSMSLDGFDFVPVIQKNLSGGWVGTPDQVGVWWNPNGNGHPAIAQGQTATGKLLSWQASGY